MGGIWIFSGTTHLAVLPFDGLDVKSVHIGLVPGVNMEDILI